MKNIGLEKILEYFDKKGWHIQCTEAGGYDADTTDKPILLADWNPVPEGMQDYLLNFYQLEWDDVSSTCIECYKYINLSPHSYGWAPNFISGEYGHVCRECVEDNHENLYEEYVNCGTVQIKAIPSWAKKLVEADGWHRLEREEMDDCESYETGWYTGQTDDPKELVETLEEDYPDHDYLFCIDMSGQFHVNWGVYIKKRGV